MMNRNVLGTGRNMSEPLDIEKLREIRDATIGEGPPIYIKLSNCIQIREGDNVKYATFYATFDPEMIERLLDRIEYLQQFEPIPKKKEHHSELNSNIGGWG